MRPRNNAVGAILLIALGAMFFLDNIGIFPFARIGEFWPMFIAAWGFISLTRCRNPRYAVWPWALIAYGVLWTMCNLGIIPMHGGQLWPIFLIAAGVGMLFKQSNPGRDWKHHAGYDPTAQQAFSDNMTAAAEANSRFEGNILHENVVFSSVNRRVDSAAFEGADLNCTFGELKVDLRGATISTESKVAYAETNASFGAIKLRIPETWKVEMQGSAVFGNYEDKTLPPRPVAGVETPKLILRGNAVFGEVKVEN